MPWESISADNVVTWQLDDMEPFECARITLDLFLDCDAEVGLNYCIDSHIYPDTLCIPPSTAWSGAFLELDADCVEDSLYFKIKNVGAANMLERSEYIIVEDAVLRTMDQTDLLITDEEYQLHLEANGATFSLLVEQVPNAPGLSFPFAVVEGCGENENGEISTGFANQFALDDSDSFEDLECPVATNSFDPNDKQASPEGYGLSHYILDNTPLEYKIRFQNTGTDTAYTVIIRDTLDPLLDITTLENGVASHVYDMEINGRGVLSFIFNNIYLPDSAANQAASNGFVTFRVSPLRGLSPGTIIRNDAAIYFDYNEPVITNETFHTIAEDFIDVIITHTSHPTISNISVLVQPNPFRNASVIEVKHHTATEYLLEVFDVSGKQVRQERYDASVIIFYKKNLSPGLYFYRLTAKDGFLNTGKMIIH